MVEKLFEALDEKIFTSEIKADMEKYINEAVETKAQELAEVMLAEKLEEVMIEHNEKLVELQESFDKTLDEKSSAFEQELDAHKKFITESVDKYLQIAIDEFVEKAQVTLEESNKVEKAEMLVEAISSIMFAAGVETLKIVDAKKEQDSQMNESAQETLEEMKVKYDELMEKFIELTEKNNEILQIGVINEYCEDMSLVESENFKNAASVIPFEKTQEFLDKLTVLKNSFKAAPATINESKVENQTTPAVSSIAVDARFL